MSEILADFLVETPSGYYCKYGDFFIDPGMPVDRAVVSHAHGDHARSGHRHIFATPATVAFMQFRFPRQPLSSYHVMGFELDFKIGEVDLKFIPAGHILGSAQVLMCYQGVRYLYTGDYKLQADPTCEPIMCVEADVLITETTFANPDIVHPEPIQEIKKLSASTHNIMLGSYTLGKAQRITNLINRHCPEKTVFVHHNIAPIHRIYETLGYVSLKYELYNRKALKDGINKIYLVPPITFNNYFRAKNVLRAFASGWKRLQHHNDIELYISDHIDWPDLLGYISQVKPKQIWTVHGDGATLRRYFEGQEVLVRNISNLATMML